MADNEVIVGAQTIPLVLQDKTKVVPDPTILLIHSDTTNGSTTFVDSSPDANSITNINSLAHSTAEAKFGASSFNIQGSGSHLEVTNSNFLFGTSNFTVDFWINFSNALVGNYRVVSRAGDDTILGRYSLQIQTDNKLHWVSGTGTEVIDLSSTVTFNGEGWKHIAVVRLGSNLSLFIDGVKDNENASFSRDYDNDVELRIGSFSDNNWPVYIDELRISNIGLYGGDFTVPTAPY